MPTNIITALGISWKLHVQEFATLTYDHPTFGILEYTGRKKWLCDNTNTVYLTRWGTLPDPSVERVLPPSICIRPNYDAVCGCATGDLSGYQNPADKCLCADPECPLPEFLTVFCSTCSERCDGFAVKGVRAGRDCPLNPSYTMTCTLCGLTISATWYCCGGQWRADVYNNGTFCSTQTLGNTRCPLTLQVGSAPFCVTWTCTGAPPTCCAGLTGNLNGSVTGVSGCGCTDTVAFTLNQVAPGVASWHGSFTLCGVSYSITSLACNSGAWPLQISSPEGSCNVTSSATNQVDCPSVLLTFTGLTCGRCVFNITLTL